MHNSPNGFQLVEIFNAPMPFSQPTSAPSAAVSELLAQAAATAYCRPALRALGAALPADDGILAAALNLAANRRDAKAFSHLYVAALYAGRRVSAEVFDLGAALLPDATLILNTALRAEGDVGAALAAAVRSGRMGHERDAFALITGWLDYERRKLPAPPEFLALTRKACREAVRRNRHFIRLFLNLAAALSGDPVAADILNLNPEGLDDATGIMVLNRARNCAANSGWDDSVPNSPVAETLLASGATLKRAVPKAGRNDPCPCGSGKKFKQCCEGKLSTSDQYAVEGVTLSEATAHPELILTPQRISKLRSYELYALDPKLLTPGIAVQVIHRLILYREVSRAIEVLKMIGREAVSDDSIDDIAYEFFSDREAAALRWIIDWAPGAVEVSFEMEVLLATPLARLKLLRKGARAALDAERSGDRNAPLSYSELGFAALLTDPALGIVIARGVLPVCGQLDQLMLLEDLENARDLLGLDNNEPGREIVNATAQASRDEVRHASDIERVRAEASSRVGTREAEIQRLKTQIDSMQESLKKREDAIEKQKIPDQENATTRAAVPAPPESAETRELRDHLRRLKDNLKVEHEERNRAMQELRAAREQLRRAVREQPENPAPEKPADSAQEAEDSATTGVEWERQALRIPEYGPAFRESLRRHPRHAAAAALAMAGRLAGGDPSTWQTVRSLKLRPGTLRARVAGDYRLLFEIGPGDTLRLIDFILRRDLDRWLTAAGR